MTNKPDNVIPLHDRITVTFSPEASRLIRTEIQRQIAHFEYWSQETANRVREEEGRCGQKLSLHNPAKPPQTPKEIAEYAIRMILGDEDEHQARQPGRAG